MESSLEQAVSLGVLQGLTEFLPVSSSGHLALAQTLFKVERAGLTMSVVLHSGTLLSTLVFFRKRIAQVLVDLVDSFRRRKAPTPNSPGWDSLLVAAASLPTGVMGLTLHDTVEQWSVQPLAIGLGFLITAALLLSTLWAPASRPASPSLATALLLGVAQGIAIFPGISRSGATIVAALWLGVRATRAFELSMLLSVPAIVGALALELGGGGGFGGRTAALVLGALVSFGVGLAALFALRQAVTRGALWWFSIWVLLLAVPTLALARAWPNPRGSRESGALAGSCGRPLAGELVACYPRLS